jgi:hypothetical protein
MVTTEEPPPQALQTMHWLRLELIARALWFVRRHRIEQGAPAYIERLWVEAGLSPQATPHEALDKALQARARWLALLPPTPREGDCALASLRAVLRLDDDALALWGGCALAEVDLSTARLWQWLQPATGAARGLGAWLELLSARPEQRLALLAALEPTAPLRALGLIELAQDHPSFLLRGVSVEQRLAYACLGLGWGARDVGAATTPAHPLALVLSDDEEAALRRLCERGSHPKVAFVGLVGTGRGARARWVAQRLGWSLVVLDPWGQGEGPAALLRAGLHEALLRGCALAVRLDALEDMDRARWKTALAALAPLHALPTPTFYLAPPSVAPLLAEAVVGLHEHLVEPPKPAELKKLWEHFLRAAQLPDPEALLDEHVLAFELRPAAVQAICRRLAAQDVPPSAARLKAAIHDHARAHLSKLAKVQRSRLSWEDVVLPDATLQLLQELLAHAKHREQVMERWGFGRKLAYGRALSALFSGPPGTGKTMVAGILASDLGRELIRVELGQVVDKYIGETEKNLDRLFQEASESQAVLLFDEADSLFSKRTEVKSSNDRYANLAVNHLLQLMESFEGICVLTTNLESAIDEAFLRRIRFRVPFPAPDARARERLWRSMIPAQAETAADIDWRGLAEEFPDMAGGHIRNAVLRAAFLAASGGGPLTHDHMFDAARAEYRELGHAVREEGR